MAASREDLVLRLVGAAETPARRPALLAAVAAEARAAPDPATRAWGGKLADILERSDPRCAGLIDARHYRTVIAFGHGGEARGAPKARATCT